MSTSNKSKLPQWEMGSRYQANEVVGKGSYGQVIKALDRIENRYVAIKKMEILFDEPINSKRAYREIRILNHLRHPCIIDLVDVVSPVVEDYAKKASSQTQTPVRRFSSDGKEISPQISSKTTTPTSAGSVNPPRNLGSIFLVFDFMDTDLSKIIKSNQNLSDEHVQFILYQILDGVHYLHTHNVIHRDLKPANILVSCVDCTIKIADFGLARVVDNEFVENQVSGKSPNSGRDSHQNSSMRRFQNLSNDSLDASSVMAKDFNALSMSLSAASNDSIPGGTAAIAPSVNPSGASSTNTVPVGGPASIAKPALRRSLTKHVVTRWYRSPEIILAQPYSAAVDIWSIGCIFAELISMMKGNQDDSKKRRPLFPGESCGDLSADDDEEDETANHEIQPFQAVLDSLDDNTLQSLAHGKEKPENILGSRSTDAKSQSFDTLIHAISEEYNEYDQAHVTKTIFSDAFHDLRKFESQKSQLNLIFELIGSPHYDEMNHLDLKSKTMLMAMPKKKPKDLHALFSNASEGALRLLKLMLQFDPLQRMSCEDAIGDHYFDPIKQQGYVNPIAAQEEQLSTNVSPATDTSTASSGHHGELLNPEREKVRESPLHLKHNFIQEILKFVRRKDPSIKI